MIVDIVLLQRTLIKKELRDSADIERPSSLQGEGMGLRVALAQEYYLIINYRENKLPIPA